MRTLYLVRHAKSSWEDSSLADHERPLNKRGLRDAPLMGQRLVDKKVRVDSIWSSPAQRAVETVRYIAKALKYPRKKICLRERIYTSMIDDLFYEISSCPDEVNNLLVVGHNSVITDFANLLIAYGRNTEIELIPTCGIVAIEFTFSSWQQLEEREGRFLFFDYPKNSAISV